MKKDVSIKMLSRQNDGMNEEEVEVFSKGIYETTDFGYRISYEETETTGMAGSETVFETFGDNKVMISRNGEITSDMVIELGTKQHCVYNSPYGTFTLGLEARAIKVELGEDGGRVFVHYVIDINSTYVGDFRITLEVAAQ